MRSGFLPALLLLAGTLTLLVAGRDRPEPAASSLTLATTTSTENSGLLSWLLEPWSRRTGIHVRVIAVGTGKALALARRGDADLVLVHARAREDAFVADGHGVDRRAVMWNDFVIAGPPADPAGIGSTHDAARALARIAERGAPFISRGDDSGTHIRERALWKRAGTDPADRAFYLKAGQGMGPCLTMADQRRAYILTDRGTFLAVHAHMDLAILVEGDALLRNPYGAILVNPARHPGVHVKAARALLDYLVSPAGQKRIGAYRVDGQVLFHPHRGGA